MLARVLLPDDVLSDGDADEVQDHLETALEASRDEPRPASTDREDRHEDERRDDADHRDPVELEDRALEQDRFREEVGQRGDVEAPVASGEHSGTEVVQGGQDELPSFRVDAQLNEPVPARRTSVGLHCRNRVQD